jgi:hypothetical protein
LVVRREAETEEMVTMQHEAHVWAEIEDRRSRLLAEAENHRKVRQVLAARRAARAEAAGSQRSVRAGGQGARARLVAAVTHLAARRQDEQPDQRHRAA